MKITGATETGNTHSGSDFATPCSVFCCVKPKPRVVQFQHLYDSNPKALRKVGGFQIDTGRGSSLNHIEPGKSRRDFAHPKSWQSGVVLETQQRGRSGAPVYLNH